MPFCALLCLCSVVLSLLIRVTTFVMCYYAFCSITMTFLFQFLFAFYVLFRVSLPFCVTTPYVSRHYAFSLFDFFYLRLIRLSSFNLHIFILVFYPLPIYMPAPFVSRYYALLYIKRNYVFSSIFFTIHLILVLSFVCVTMPRLCRITSYFSCSFAFY